MEQLNHLLFSWINATPASPKWLLSVAFILANDMILIVPATIAALWLWGNHQKMAFQREVVSKTVIALLFAMACAKTLSVVFPHPRPFMESFGYTFLQHSADSSFPSDHGTAIFTFALAFLFWHRLWSGVLFLLLGLGIAWSRVYVGVHWPLDMLGAFLVALLGCLFSQLLWNLFGIPIGQRLEKLYHLCFAIPIRKGWVRG